MSVQRFSLLRVWSVLILLLSLGLITACSGGEAEAEPQQLNTRLLVRAPDGPLPVGKPLIVKSRSVDELENHYISHVELYAVELPSGQRDVLIRSDDAPFSQKYFTALQEFTPLMAGRYVIKVVVYNNVGEGPVESEYISFDVVQ